MLAGHTHEETPRPALSLGEIEEAILGGTTSRRGEAVIARGEGCYLVGYGGPPLSGLHVGAGRGHARPLPPGAQPGDRCASRHADLVPQLPLQRRARPLCRQAGRAPAPDLQHVFLANSGAEAIDGALKFARLVTGRTNFVAFR